MPEELALRRCNESCLYRLVIMIGRTEWLSSSRTYVWNCIFCHNFDLYLLWHFHDLPNSFFIMFQKQTSIDNRGISSRSPSGQGGGWAVWGWLCFQMQQNVSTQGHQSLCGFSLYCVLADSPCNVCWGEPCCAAVDQQAKGCRRNRLKLSRTHMAFWRWASAMWHKRKTHTQVCSNLTIPEN